MQGRSSPRALAAGDAEAACASFTARARRAQSGHVCGFLERTAAEMTVEEARRSRTATGRPRRYSGDRATGYLQYGDCILRTSGSELVRDESGWWRIDGLGAVGTGPEETTCLGAAPR